MRLRLSRYPGVKLRHGLRSEDRVDLHAGSYWRPSALVRLSHRESPLGWKHPRSKVVRAPQPDQLTGDFSSSAPPPWSAPRHERSARRRCGGRCQGRHAPRPGSGAPGGSASGRGLHPWPSGQPRSRSERGLFERWPCQPRDVIAKADQRLADEVDAARETSHALRSVVIDLGRGPRLEHLSERPRVSYCAAVRSARRASSWHLRRSLRPLPSGRKHRRARSGSARSRRSRSTVVTGGRPISKGSKHRLIGKLQGATRRRNLRRFRKAAESRAEPARRRSAGADQVTQKSSEAIIARCITRGRLSQSVILRTAELQSVIRRRVCAATCRGTRRCAIDRQSSPSPSGHGADPLSYFLRRLAFALIEHTNASVAWPAGRRRKLYGCERAEKPLQPYPTWSACSGGPSGQSRRSQLQSRSGWPDHRDHDGSAARNGRPGHRTQAV